MPWGTQTLTSECGAVRASKTMAQNGRGPDLGGGFKCFLFHPYLGKIPTLTNIFEMGWNHQAEIFCGWKIGGEKSGKHPITPWMFNSKFYSWKEAKGSIIFQESMFSGEYLLSLREGFFGSLREDVGKANPNYVEILLMEPCEILGFQLRTNLRFSTAEFLVAICPVSM